MIGCAVIGKYPIKAHPEVVDSFIYTTAIY